MHFFYLLYEHNSGQEYLLFHICFAFWLSEEVLSYVLWDSRALSHNYFLSTAYFLYMQSNLKTKYRPAITFKIILTYSLPMV